MAKTQKELLLDLYQSVSEIKEGFIEGELHEIYSRMDEMQTDVRAIKKQLLDPEAGIIVKVNKNTEFRRAEEAKVDDEINLKLKIEELTRWQSTATRVLWIVVTTLVALGTKVLFF